MERDRDDWISGVVHETAWFAVAVAVAVVLATILLAIFR